MTSTEDFSFGENFTTPKGILLDADYIAKVNTDEKYGKDRYMAQIGIPKDVDLGPLKKAIDKLKNKEFPGVEDDALDLPVSDGDAKTWGPGKGKWVIKPKCKKNRPFLVDQDNKELDYEVVQAGMPVRARLVPMAFDQGKKARGITLVLKMLKIYTNTDHEVIVGGRESAEDAFSDEMDDV